MDRVEWEMAYIAMHYTGEVFSPLLTSGVRFRGPRVLPSPDDSGSDFRRLMIPARTCPSLTLPARMGDLVIAAEGETWYFPSQAFANGSVPGPRT
jgi:hypothetical protein